MARLGTRAEPRRTVAIAADADLARTAKLTEWAKRNQKTVQICTRYSKAILPGVLTPTEVMTAWDAGADMVKIFPCGNMGGPSYINALKAPLPQVLMVPTGGVKLDNTAEFFKAGASAVAVGADICNTKAMAEGRYDEIEKKARAFLSAVADYRQAAVA